MANLATAFGGEPPDCRHWTLLLYFDTAFVRGEVRLSLRSILTLFLSQIMPSYDYVCDACGHEFEEFQYIKDEPLRKCPECKKLKLRRLISGGAGIVFKGSGFYQTDYRSESYKKGESTAKSSSTDSPGGTSGSTDKKSDKKSDAKTTSDKASSNSKS